MKQFGKRRPSYVRRAMLRDFWPEHIDPALALHRTPGLPDIIIRPEPLGYLSRGQKLRRRLFAIEPWCLWCDRPFADPDEATLEHLLGRAFGGRDSMANCRLACATCNRKRGAWYYLVLQGQRPPTLYVNSLDGRIKL